MEIPKTFDEFVAEARNVARLHRENAPPVKVFNERAVLDLGNLTFHTFRGRAYGVPPLPYKDGLRLARLSAQLRAFRGGITAETIPHYYALVATMPGLLWRLSVPVGRVRRLLHRLHLHRNPFRKASEAELGELLAFFLSCRMKSSVRPLPDPRDLAPSIS